MHKSVFEAGLDRSVRSLSSNPPNLVSCTFLLLLFPPCVCPAQMYSNRVAIGDDFIALQPLSRAKSQLGKIRWSRVRVQSAQNMTLLKPRSPGEDNWHLLAASPPPAAPAPRSPSLYQPPRRRPSAVWSPCAATNMGKRLFPPGPSWSK
ncbi:hypothetical protein WMY93_002633 [Mugilogobius chulae]|uniref:Uncharacterized protein n=1 Tax=Mugilogobius chulae TaxID=88201 RepID=A0AAW0Q465_9GOBI